MEPAPPQTLPPVKEGEEILVQVVKDPIGSKDRGCPATSAFDRFLVLMPGIEHVGISPARSLNPQEARAAGTLIKSHAQPGEGFIVRTRRHRREGTRTWSATSGAPARTVGRTAGQLPESPAPSLVWKDASQKVLPRDLFREEAQLLGGPRRHLPGGGGDCQPPAPGNGWAGSLTSPATCRSSGGVRHREGRSRPRASPRSTSARRQHQHQPDRGPGLGGRQHRQVRRKRRTSRRPSS